MACDLLSSLCDGVLARILSLLPADEAARAAVLSRLWRYIFSAVDVLSFKETADRPIPPWEDGDWSSPSSYGRPDEDPHYIPCEPFALRVCAAIGSRHRGRRVPVAPLRALRVAFKEFEGNDAKSAPAVDWWLSHAAYQSGEELLVDLRFDVKPLCDRVYATVNEDIEVPDHEDNMEEEEDSDDDMVVEEQFASTEYFVPSFLFRCATLRTLRIGPCRLNPPATISLPSLDTMHLIRVTDQNATIKRLVSGCPRLADLTLEACNNVTKLSVCDTTRLRRVALRCCHNLKTVAADLTELRTFEYRGGVPPPKFRRSMDNPSRITSCVLDFCGWEITDPGALVSLRNFFHLFASARHLELKSARLGAGVSHGVFSRSPALPIFASLRELELTGILHNEDTATVATVTRILERTPSLEILSLFFLPEPLKERDQYRHYSNEDIFNEHCLKYDRYASLVVPVSMEIPCLRKRTKEINFVHYQGALAQRRLAKFLLRNAPMVAEVCCEFAKGPLTMQTQLMEEIRGWVLNKSANMITIMVIARKRERFKMQGIELWSGIHDLLQAEKRDDAAL
ncbi:hypothetical protein EJB05_26326, partial [Eragrostis curvula]